MKELDLTTLRSAVAGSAVAVRSITRLQPAGGPGDKVFPPTYMKEKGAETKYALERRRIEGAGLELIPEGLQGGAFEGRVGAEPRIGQGGLQGGGGPVGLREVTIKREGDAKA